MSRLMTDGRTTDNGQRNVKIELEFWKQNSQFDKVQIRPQRRSLRWYYRCLDLCKLLHPSKLCKLGMIQRIHVAICHIGKDWLLDMISSISWSPIHTKSMFVFLYSNVNIPIHKSDQHVTCTLSCCSFLVLSWTASGPPLPTTFIRGVLLSSAPSQFDKVESLFNLNILNILSSPFSL